MIQTRIIPRLDIKGPNLVKGIHLEGLRVIGKPEKFAKHYYEQGADELLYMDVVASLYGRNSLDEIIRRTAEEIFIPLTVGGGIRSLHDIQRVLFSGADKVSLNTAVIHNPNLISEAVNEFGSSTIVVSIEALRSPDGTYEAYIDNGREKTGVNAIDWAMQVEDLGAGEILITSIDHEGTGSGYDLSLIHKISDLVRIPVIACGGAGSCEHIFEVIDRGKADAVCIASLLHYDFIKHNSSEDDFSDEGNIEFLKSRRDFKKITPCSLPMIKEYLHNRSIDCRYFVES
jgi:cyclase